MSAPIVAEPVDLTGVVREIVGIETPGLPPTGWGLPQVRGVFHRPVDQPRPRVAFVATHYNLDFSSHYLADHLVREGFGFLGWNTRFCGREAYFVLDQAVADIGHGVRWLRERGVERIVLLGNSGGGSLMAAYQAQATGGVLRPGYEMELDPGVEGLDPGDLYVSVAAHPGRPEVLTNWLDPAVVDEQDPVRTDPDLDMYDPRNGPPYAPEFLARYRTAQRERNHRITAWAKDELRRVQRHGLRDRLFALQRTWADPRFMDPTLDPSDRPARFCYRGDPQTTNRGVDGLGTSNTLRTWLSMWSLAESQCRSAEHLPAIDVPALVIQPTADAGVFPSDAQAILDGLGSADKQLVEMPGDHYFRGAEGTPRADVARRIAAWVASRSEATTKERA